MNITGRFEQFRIRFNALFERVCVFVIQWGSALILWIPLVTTPQTLFFYIFGKTIFFQTAVEALLPFWLFLCIYRERYRPPLFHPVVLSLTAFMIFLIVSALIGVDPVRSFWSTQERMTGIILLLHCYVWFLILISVLKEWSQWRAVLIFGLLGNILVGLYGLGQRLQVNILLPDFSATRLTSTLGNAIYLGAYSLIFIYVSAFLLSRERHNLWRMVFVFSLFFNAFILYKTASRGVTLTLVVTLFAFGVVSAFSVKNSVWKSRILKSVLGTSLAGVVLVGVLYTPLGREWADTQLPDFGKEIVYEALKDPGRLALWNVGLKGFLDRPLFGWGWENFAYINDTYIHRARGSLGNPWNDHSHNQVIDIFALTGIFGGIAYLTFWVVLLGLLTRKIRSTTQFSLRLPLLIAFFLLIAYFLQNLTIFDTPAPLIVFYCLLALSYYLIGEKRIIEKLSGRDGLLRKQERESLHLEQKSLFPLVGFVLFPGLVLASSFLIYSVNLRDFFISSAGIRSLRITGSGDIEKGLEGFNTVFSKNSFTRYELREHLVEAAEATMSNERIPADQKEKLIRRAVEEAEKSVSEKPHDLRYALRLIYLYRTFSSIDETANDRAEKLAEKTLVLYPNRYELYKELAESAFYRKDNEKGIEYAKKAVDVDILEARSLWYLAIAYGRAGDSKKALDAAWQAMATDDNAPPLEYLTLLSQVIPVSLTDTAVLEYFTTLAAAYGYKDQRFYYARNEVFARTNELGKAGEGKK